MVHYQYLLITASQVMKKDDVLKHFGSRVLTAKALCVTRQYVSQWKDIIPMGIAYKAESVTGGALKVDPALYVTKRGRRYGKQ